MPAAKNTATKTAKPPKNESRDDGWLPYQRVLIGYREAGNSITALGKKAGVDIAQLSRATTTPGKTLDDDVLRRLVPHLPGLAEAVATHMANIASFIGLPAQVQTVRFTEAAGPQDGRTYLAHSQIHQSLRLNPRKKFDHDELAELAESIALHDILQNLTVRKSEGGRYELVAGERRWRAVGLLVTQGRWNADEANIPVKIIEAEEGEARAIALLENLQRVEISPLEEAGAFAELQALDPDTWTTDAIAKAIGKDGESGQRYVLQRLALAYKLEDDARDLLRDGRLTFEKARYLTQCKPDVQRQVCAELERGDPDLNSLFEHFRSRVQAIAAAMAPKDDKPKTSAAAAGERQQDGGQEPAYRGTIAAPGSDAPPAPDYQPDGDHDPDDLAIGLPDPASWVLQTSTPRLQTITLMAPTAEAFEAALRLFSKAQTEAA